MSLTSKYFPSRYLRADSLPKKRNCCTISSCKEESFRSDDGTKSTKLCLFLEEFEPGLIMNKTNLIALENAFGSNIANWTGKSIVLRKDVANFQNRVVDCIRVEAGDGEEAEQF